MISHIQNELNTGFLIRRRILLAFECELQIMDCLDLEGEIN